MSKELDKPNQKTDLAKERQLFLLNLDNGRIFPWTPLLAVRKHFIDCTADGKPINPKDVPGDHPWIKQSTESLRDRMVGAGANSDTLADFGRQLSDDAAAKFKALEFEKAVKQLENIPAYNEAQVGATIRINNKIDLLVARAKTEIRQMTYEALLDHGLTPSEALKKLV